MRAPGSRLRPWAFLLMFALVAIAVGFGLPRSARRGEKLVTADSGLMRQTAASPGRATQGGMSQELEPSAALRAPDLGDGRGGPLRPIESRLIRAHTYNGDLRNLPTEEPEKIERPEREAPEFHPIMAGSEISTEGVAEVTSPQAVQVPAAPVPPTIQNFEGMNFAANGAGHPPDTNGDVGPNHYIQTINTSIGIYNKNGTIAAGPFTFNTFMSQGNFGNLCDTNNFGDPVVLYDSFEDRWIITDFAFQLSGGAVVNPPGAFQCFAASKTGDPVSGGWNFFSLHLTDFLNDYPKFGIWPDGLYMTANLFGFPAGGSFAGVRVWALNKAQMYSGSPTVQVVSFNVGGGDFTILPSNARLQTGTPPPGRPNFFVSTSQFLNALTVYKFHVDWNSISLSTFTGPQVPVAASSWPNQSVANAQSLGGNAVGLDTLSIRNMMQNQYTNFGGVESLWDTHTVRRALNGLAAPRFYQVNVTGGNVAPAIPQAATFDPDGANVFARFMPSLALDRAGNMALGYSTSSSTTKPAIKYAGRLATDPINTFPQTEQLLIQGAGTQVGNCGPGPCARWGDYSAMTLDPDGCTFWYTNMYYQVDGLDHHTRVGSFTYPSCTPVGAGGTVTGTVTATPGGAPISGATVSLGVRTTTTDGSGNYAFTGIPAGTYPTMTASAPGYNTATASSIVVTDGGTTIQNFALSLAPQSACLTDTTQADFLTGVGTNVDLTTSPGNVILAKPLALDQQNTSLSTSGNVVSTTSWSGQTFLPAITGKLARADVNLFCFGCTGTAPVVTVAVRATSGGLPTGPDLAAATFTTSTSGAGAYYSANFGSPATLTAGTTYALVVRNATDPSAGGLNAITRSAANAYANGARVTSGDSGATWTAQTTDIGFKTFMDVGFTASGDLVSGTKDANPAVGNSPSWTTLSWNASVPANTGLKFQAAASTNPGGPFNFVGPDGTAGTFFTTSPASIAQFTGRRYLKYKAFLSTTDGAVSPTLNDVTVCFADLNLAGKVWVGLANSDDVGIKFDLMANVYRNGVPIGTGHVDSVLGGSSGFNNAKLDTIPILLTDSPAGGTLSIQVYARNACVGSGHNSGRARLWYNGQPIDTGATRDAGSRFGIPNSGSATDYFLRTGSALSTTAGAAKASVDVQAGAKCGPFVSFGTWTLP